jgi:hypothetical protein
VSSCVVNPAAAGCAVVVPPSTQQGSGPLDPVVNNINQVINTSTQGVGGSGGPPLDKSGDKPADKKDDKKDEKASSSTNPLGEAKGVSKKLYCN